MVRKATFVYIKAKLGQDNMEWWDDSEATVTAGLDIYVLAIWCRTGYLSITETSHNTQFLRLEGEEQLWVKVFS